MPEQQPQKKSGRLIPPIMPAEPAPASDNFVYESRGQPTSLPQSYEEPRTPSQTPKPGYTEATENTFNTIGDGIQQLFRGERNLTSQVAALETDRDRLQDEVTALKTQLATNNTAYTTRMERYELDALDRNARIASLQKAVAEYAGFFDKLGRIVSDHLKPEERSSAERRLGLE